MGIGSIIVQSLVSVLKKEIRGAVQNATLEALRAASLKTPLKIRLQHIGTAHASIIQNFLTPLCAVHERLSSTDIQSIKHYLFAMNERGDELLNNPAVLDDAHVTGYATSVKEAAIVAITLCQKYRVRPDIESITYDSIRKTIMLNGQDLYQID
jgi:hypothetical protein